jgi:hypothetical protein
MEEKDPYFLYLFIRTLNALDNNKRDYILATERIISQGPWYNLAADKHKDDHTIKCTDFIEQLNKFSNLKDYAEFLHYLKGKNYTDFNNLEYLIGTFLIEKHQTSSSVKGGKKNTFDRLKEKLKKINSNSIKETEKELDEKTKILSDKVKNSGVYFENLSK